MLGQKEADIPYEVEELDLRLYTKEEVCYFIYNYLPLISESFMSDGFLHFLDEELGMKDTVEKIRKLCASGQDQDTLLLTILFDVGYYSEPEITEFQQRLISRKRKTGFEKLFEKGQALQKMKRYQGALRAYHAILHRKKDARITPDFLQKVYLEMANSYGFSGAYEEAIDCFKILYDETKKEKYLKKIHDVSMLSGIPIPDEISKKISDKKFGEYQEDYEERQLKAKARVDEDPIMKVFFQDETIAKVELMEYIDMRKEELRGMLA